MPPTAMPPTAMPPHDDDRGFTLVEVMIASIIALALLVSASVAMTATTHAVRTESTQGSTTSSALIAVQEIQSLLGGTWTSGSLGGEPSVCSGGIQGSNSQLFPSGQGPFVTATGTDLMFCAFRNNSTTSATFEIHFTGCSTHNVCTLKIDQEPGPGVCPCTVNTIFSMPGIYDGGTGANAPFVYDYYQTTNPVGWTSTSQLNQIQAVKLTLSVSGGGGSGTNVQRLVLLPNTLAGGS